MGFIFLTFTLAPKLPSRSPSSGLKPHKNWQINLRDISEWGDIIPPEGMISLGDDLLDYVESQVYTPMSDAQKIHAIYSPWTKTPEKHWWNKLFLNMIEKCKISKRISAPIGPR